MRDQPEAARCIEPGGQLVRECFVLDEALLARATDGLLVEASRLQLPTFQACDLGAHERGAVREVRRAVLGPCFDLATVHRQRLQAFGTVHGGRRIAQRSTRQRGVQVILRRFEE